VQIDKQSVLNKISDPQLRRQVEEQLPDTVDLDQHAELLRRLNIDPQDLLEGGGLLPAYAEHATCYEQRTRSYQDWRRQVVDLLPLRGGDVVLDVGCGTGLCFPLLQARVGAGGTIVGIDESPQMLAVAHRQAQDHAWHNVTLLASSVEQAPIPVTADAAVFCAVHDILQSPAALHTVFSHLRPGAWVAAGGGKWAPWWMGPLNLFVLATHQPYVRDFRGFDRPWRLLEGFLEGLRVTEVAFGSGYLALGRTRTITGCRHVGAFSEIDVRECRCAVRATWQGLDAR
jgi:SAM-dependent methyltransferase